MAGGDVTVLGGAGKTFTLHFDTNANAQLASVLAANISAGVLDNSISPSNDATPPLSGKIGEFVDTNTPFARLPQGYDAVVNVNTNATILGSGGNGESVLSGASNLTFVATGGSGTVVAGAGSPHKGQDDRHKGRVAGGNTITVPLSDYGNWLIETGGGNDTISARGGGNDTIGAGRGHNLISLGSGNDLVQSSGYDTIHADSGAVNGRGNEGLEGPDLCRQQPTDLCGRMGSATIIGGTRQDEIHGGSAGKNSIVAGSDTGRLSARCQSGRESTAAPQAGTSA